MALKQELMAILKPDSDEYVSHMKLAVGKRHDGSYEIEYSAMYRSPNLNFSKLLKLSELFGTEKIDVDDYEHEGCDTCDWGSEYGHTIQIYEPTKNVDELEQLVGILVNDR